jgi:glycosyl transferase family 10 (putative fucosyltransferase)
VDVFVAFPGWMGLDRQVCPGCRLAVMRTRHRLSGLTRRADALVFHIPTTPQPIPLRRASGQTWVAWSMESDANYPQLADPRFMAQFDLTMTYRQDADIVVSYCRPEDWLDFRPSPIAAAGYERAPAVYMASSPVNRSGRTEYVRELMRHMPVDSYGRILNTRALVADQGRPTKLETIGRYRFTLAFENSIARDYVTEKFYDPLLVGSVPVYLGAPNVIDHAPAASCYIDVRDFAGPRELANFLLELSSDEARYAEYLEWRERPLDARFLALAREQGVPAWCRLCRLLRERAS